MPLVPAAGPPLVDLLDDLVSRFVLNCPEEEKASFDRLFFQIESAYWFYDDHYREKYPDQYPTLTLKGFAEKLFKHCDVLKPYKGQSAELFAKFTDYKGQVPTYGAVILDRTLTKLLLIRSWHGSTWSFPKGKINKDEAEHECAIREVLEEIGLDLRMYLDTSQFLEHSYGRGTTMKLFLTHGVDESVHLETRTKKEIGAIVWHPLSELGTESTKKDKDYWIVQQLIGRIKKWAGERRKEVKGSAAGGKDSRRGAAAAQSPPAAQSLQVLPALAAYALFIGYFSVAFWRTSTVTVRAAPSLHFGALPPAFGGVQAQRAAGTLVILGALDVYLTLLSVSVLHSYNVERGFRRRFPHLFASAFLFMVGDVVVLLDEFVGRVQLADFASAFRLAAQYFAVVGMLTIVNLGDDL